MISGELAYAFFATVVMTALVAMFVLWRYRVAVLKSMNTADGPALPLPSADRASPQPMRIPDQTSAEDWERAVHRRVILSWMISVGFAAPILAFVTLVIGDMPLSPSHLVFVSCVSFSVAVPMIAVSLAWPFWRGVRFFLLVLVLSMIVAVASSILQRILTGRAPSLDQLLNAVDFLQLTMVSLWLPAILLLATGSARLRGVAPITFTGLLIFGLAPFLGMQAFDALAGSAAGSQVLMVIPAALFMHAGTILFALPAGWLAWLRLHTVTAHYDEKRFSDVQLLAQTWWLMFVAMTAFELINAHLDRWWWTVGGCLTAYVVFVVVSRSVFGWLGVAQDSRQPRTLLLLRVFGFTERTEKLYDRIGARWRYFGPVTMIAAPDVVARTIDPGDFLHYMLGSIDQTFVRTAADLQRRITTLDTKRDPDGRYRVNKFCCADNTWQATVIELMQGCDVVLMDLRSITRERLGCEFELQQLAARVEADRIFLVVDSVTDRTILYDALGSAAQRVTFFELNDNSPDKTSALFKALLQVMH